MAGSAKKRKGNDEGKAKKVSPYFNFCKFNRDKVKDSHPNTSVNKALSLLWKSLTDDQRAAYALNHSPPSDDTPSVAAEGQSIESPQHECGHNDNVNDDEEEEQEEEEGKESGVNSPAFPLARVRRIIKLDKDIRQVSGDVVWVIANAARLMVETLTESALRVALEKKHKSIRLDHIALAIKGQRRLSDFLEDSLSNINSIPDDAHDDPTTTTTSTKPSKNPNGKPQKPPPPGVRSITHFFGFKTPDSHLDS